MPTTAELVTALQRTPLLTVPDMRAELDEHRNAHGMYSWWVVPDQLPDVPSPVHPTEPVGLVYVGIGPGSATSLKRKLRDRFRDHTRGNTGGSTFRLVLASFLFQREGWEPCWTDRPLLAKADNDALTEWQIQSLRMQWVEVSKPWDHEEEVVHAMRPPLNRQHNQGHPFYAEVGRRRERFRQAARANGLCG